MGNLLEGVSGRSLVLHLHPLTTVFPLCCVLWVLLGDTSLGHLLEPGHDRGGSCGCDLLKITNDTCWKGQADFLLNIDF